MINPIARILAPLLVLLYGTAAYATNSEVSWSADTGWQDSGSSIAYSDGKYTISADKGLATNPPIVNATSGEVRVYANGTLTVASTDSTPIGNIQFTLSPQGIRRLSEMIADTGTMSYDTENWTVSWSGDASSVTITVGEKATLGTDGATKAGQFCIISPVIIDGDSNGGGTTVKPSDVISIKEAQSLKQGTDCSVRGTICATGLSGFIIGDGSDYIFYYNPSASDDYQVGNIVKIQGALGNYGGFNQFVEGAKITVEGKGTPPVAMPKVMSGSDVDAWMSKPTIQYVEISGVLNMSGAYYNVAMSGTGVLGSLGYSSQELLSTLVEGRSYTIRGYAFMSTGNRRYISIIATDITSGSSPAEPDTTLRPDIPIGAVCINFTERYSDLAQGAVVRTYTRNGIELTLSPQGLSATDSYGYSTLRLPAATELTVKSANGNTFSKLIFGLPTGAALLAADGTEVSQLLPIAKADAPSATFTTTAETDIFYIIADYSGNDDEESEEQKYRLTINIPETLYKEELNSFYLCAANTATGAKQTFSIQANGRYILTDVPDQTSFDIYFCDASGNAISKPLVATVSGSHRTITLQADDMPELCILDAKITDKAGAILTESVSLKWLRAADGSVVGSGSRYKSAPKGSAYKLMVSLPDAMRHRYTSPDEVSIIAEQAELVVEVALDTIPEILLSGLVVDKLTNEAIPGAVVSVTRTYSRTDKTTSSVKTDADGAVSLTGAAVHSELSVAKEGYITARYTFSDEQIKAIINEAGTVIDAGRLALAPVSGTSLRISIGYQDNEGSVSDIYPNLNDINIEITADGAPVSNTFSYPVVVITDNVDASAQLTVTATSKSASFMPASTICLASDSDINITIKEKGEFQISHEGEGSILLFNKDGNFVASRDATSDTTIFDSLDDGKYTIVGLFTDDAGKWASLRLIEQAGLKVGTDYIAVESECRSGAVTALSLGTIPESAAAVTVYTGDATAISLNKNEATIGNNVTVTAFVDFAAEYISAVKKPQLNVTLPAGVAFVANSVLVDSKAQSYNFDAATSTLSVPLNTTGSKVRFCISATEASAHCIAASVNFELENSSLIQPIGTITLTGLNLNLNVPSVVNDERLTAAGNCTAGSSVDIFDGDVLIGNTVADNSGAWSCNVALHEPFNSSVHRLSAKVSTPDGRSLDTESQNVTVDLYRIVPLKVTMINTDHSGKAPGEQRTVFNLETSTFEGNSYYRYWPAYPTFSFIIELSNNSADAVEDLGLLVYTTKQTWRALQGVYNRELGLWTASGDFQASELPAGLKVNILASTPDVADRRMHTSADEAVAVIMNDYNASRASDDIPDDAELSDPDMESYYASLSDAELEALISEDSIDDTIQQIEDLLKDTDVLFAPSLSEAPELAALCGIKYLSYKERSDDELLAEGYTRVDFTDGKPLYTRTQTDVVDVIDTAEKIHWQYTISADMLSTAALAPVARASADELHQLVKDATAKIHSAIQNIKSYYENLSEKFSDLEKVIEKEISKVEHEYIAARELRGRRRNALATLEERLKTTTDPDAIAGLERQIAQQKNSIARLDRQVDSMKKSIKNGKSAVKDLRHFSGWLKKVLPLTDIISKCYDAIETFQRLVNVFDSLPKSCTCDEDRFIWLNNEAKAFCIGEVTFLTARINLDLVNMVASIGGTVASGGTALPLVATKELVKRIVVDLALDFAHQKIVENWSERIKRRAAELKKGCPPPCDDPKPNEPDPLPQICSCKPICLCYRILCECPSCNPKPPYPIPTPIQDPSGFVYEGVESNRIEGVTATVYLKRTVENDFGDPVDDIRIWDAASYGQENPLLTDENGYYRWDVPEGQWQVRFEKEGYLTTSTEWLPVPPPQLDVNVDMIHQVAPEVDRINATPTLATIVFDKPMDCVTLNAATVFIKDKGAIVNGTIEFAEPSEKDGRTLAAEMTFRPERAFTGRSIEIEIGKDVKAYSGISLGEDYHGTAQVLSEVSTISIIGDPVFTVGESTEINLAVGLASQTEDVKVRAEIATPSVLSLSESSATVDANGMAHFTGYGIMAGKAIVKFSVENTDTEYTLTAAVSHKAKSKVERPVASLAENTPVAQGTPLYLSTPTAGAYILYTVDGNDPSLVSESVLHYDGSPIIINDDITVRAIAVAPDMEDSDEASFRYVVNKISGAERPDAGSLCVSVSPNPVDDILTIRSGNDIRKVSVYGTTGIKVAEHTCDRACSEVEINIKNIAGGIYIVMTETSDGVSEHRIVKR